MSELLKMLIGIIVKPSIILKIIQHKNFWLVFSHIIVPIGIIAYWYAGLMGVESLIRINPISKIDLRTTITNGSLSQESFGTVLLVEPERNDYKFLWSENIDKLWLSLDKKSYLNNQDRIIINRNELSVQTPLYGFSEPFAIVLRGKPKLDILVPGGIITPNSISSSPKKGIAIALWIFVVVVMTTGLAMGHVAFSFMAIKKNSARNHIATKSEP